MTIIELVTLPEVTTYADPKILSTQAGSQLIQQFMY